MGAITVDLTISVQVQDPQELWDAALAQARVEGVDEESLTRLLGERDDPDLGACVQMLLDRGEHLKGAEIECSTAEITGTGFAFGDEEDS